MEKPDYYSMVDEMFLTRTSGMTVETWEPKQKAWVPASDNQSNESIFGGAKSLGSDEKAAFAKFQELTSKKES